VLGLSSPETLNRWRAFGANEREEDPAWGATTTAIGEHQAPIGLNRLRLLEESQGLLWSELLDHPRQLPPWTGFGFAKLSGKRFDGGLACGFECLFW
jgi:hypothetical protein